MPRPKKEEVIEVKEVKPKYTIVEAFRDKNNFDKKWVPGDDISHFKADRVAYLIEKGFIK